MRALYAEHAGPLFAFALRLTAGDRQRAEDVVQETLLRAWRNAHKLDEQGSRSLRPWLMTVARRIVIDSAGLGMLMGCYTHAVRNAGVLKLLNPNSQVKRVLSLTRSDSVVPTFEDENAALQSFQ